MSHILLLLSDYMVLLNGDKHIYANYFYILNSHLNDLRKVEASWISS